MKVTVIEALEQLYQYKLGLLNLDPSTHSCKQLHEYVSKIIYYIYANGIDDDKYNSFTSELENDISIIDGKQKSYLLQPGDHELFLKCRAEVNLTLGSLIDSLHLQTQVVKSA
ncbi:MAG: hypothetical protein JST87_01530 [Bacteroidetes bacterium]|nr:hypothetical protein [Bacteroidota bacterium]